MATLMSRAHQLSWRPALLRGGLIIILLGLCFFDTCANGLKIGNMTPLNPLVETGHEVNLTCTLDKAEPYNASFIYFQFSNRVIPANYVTVEDELNARLSFPNATRNMSGHWFCYLNATDSGRKQVGQQSVSVADRPVKPRITGCRVFNWENMTCWWEPKVQDTGLVTTQALYWTLLIFQPDPPNYHCPYQQNNSCTWISLDGKNSFKFGRHYKIFVVAYNNLTATVSNANQVDTNKIVEPNPVSKLKVSEITKDSALLTWLAPKEGYHSEYRINYTWAQQSKVEKTFDQSIQLRNLKPASVYTVVVDNKPKEGQPDPTSESTGFWSKNVTIHFTTLESVPTAAPPVAPGGFKIEENHKNARLRDVIIYWKYIPAEHRNGKIRDYRITYVPENGKKMDEFIEAPALSTTLPSLKKDQSYEVTVNAATDIGYNDTLALSTITIPKSSDVPGQPTEFIAIKIRPDLVQLNWTAVEGATSYTIYWCRGSTEVRICKDELEWEQTLGNDTFYDLGIEIEPSEYIFAVSVEQQLEDEDTKDTARRRRAVGEAVISSGLKWADCTYDAEKYPATPNGVKFAERQEGGSLTVEWLKPKCAETGYIQHYDLMYCASRDCPGNDPQLYNPEYVHTIEIDSFSEASIYSHTLTDVNEKVHYKVWMRSISPFTDPSKNSTVQQQAVLKSGLDDGIIALIVICGIVALFLIIFCIVSCIKKCRKKMKEQTILIERPPEIRDNIPDKAPEPDDEEYHWGLTTLLDSNQHAIYTADGSNRGIPSVAQETLARARIYMNGSDTSHGKSVGSKKGYMGQPECSIDSVSSNDTVLTLLQHDASSESLDEVFDGGKAGGGMNRSYHDNLRLSTVPEESTKDDGGGEVGRGGNYNTGSSSGANPKLGASIQEYSKFGLKEEETTDDEHTYHTIDEPDIDETDIELKAVAEITNKEDKRNEENVCYNMNNHLAEGDTVPKTPESPREDGGGHPTPLPNGLPNGAPTVNGDMAPYTQVGLGTYVSKDPKDLSDNKVGPYVQEVPTNNNNKNKSTGHDTNSPSQPLGLQGYKKIEDLMVNNHLPSNHDRSQNSTSSIDSESYVQPNWNPQEGTALVPNKNMPGQSFTGYLPSAQV